MTATPNQAPQRPASRVTLCVIYVAVVVMWLMPDRRIERLLQHSEHD
jgi:hypothetical protein